MKNFFSINKTDNRDADSFDEVPYLAATVSEGVRAKMKDAFSVVEEEYTAPQPTAEEAALKKKMNRYWMLCFGCLMGSIILFFGGTSAGIYTSLPYLHVIDGGLLIASLVFNFKARRLGNQQTKTANDSLKLDFTEAGKKLEEAAAEAARELGVPEQALSVDILPFHYIVKGGERKPAGKKGRFDNVSVSVFVRDGDLCMATAQELYRVPLSEIRGVREYDEDFEIEMWLKPEAEDSDRYKAYGIRKSGILARKGHGYFGVDIGGEYEVLVPCYDFPAVDGLLKLTRLS